MKIEINIDEYFTPEMIKEIAEDELRGAFRRQFQRESDVERVISKLSYEFVFTLVAEQWDGDFAELLRKKIRDAIEGDTLKYMVFRRKDAWERTESPTVAILDEECKNARAQCRNAVGEDSVFAIKELLSRVDELEAKNNRLEQARENANAACAKWEHRAQKGRGGLSMKKRKYFRKCGICGERFEQSEMVRDEGSPTGWLCVDCHMAQHLDYDEED